MNIKYFLKSPLIFTIILFLISVAIINPVGEFVINDDWLFSRQVLAFTLGKYKINSQIDPVFILQGLLGWVWVSIFGFSHAALRILTILVTLGGVFGLYKVLKLFNLSEFVIRLVLIIFLFNPLVYTSAFSFMTENYFLFFYIWNIYFYLRYFKTGNIKNLLFGSIFCGLSFLVRQVGLFTIAAFLLVRIIEAKRESNTKFLLRDLLFTLVSFALALSVFIFWPRYPSEINLQTASYLTNTVKNISGLSSIKNSWMLYLFSLFYFSYFLLPLAATIPIKFRKASAYILIFLLSVPLTFFIYNYDLFPIGGVFYLEGLHTKSYAQQNFSLFDNIPFKIFLAFLIACTFCYLIYGFWRKGQFYKDKTNQFLVAVTLLNIAILLVASDYYGRYLLVPYVSFLILVVNNFFEVYEVRKLSFWQIALVCLFIFVTFSLQWDYFSRTKLSWQQAKMLGEKYNLTTNIYLSGPYEKYMKAVKDEDFTGYNDSPTGDYKCFIYSYTLDTDIPIFKKAATINDLIGEKLLANPKIYQGRKPQGQPKIKNNLDSLEYNKEYTSLHYNLVGKKSYVGSFCPND